MYLNKVFSEFIDDLASEKSSPGGGSVAALTGAQAVSLVLMVSRLTLGKKKYEDVQAEVEEIIRKADPIKSSLMGKVDEDVAIFGEIMGCYKIPKEERDGPLKECLKKSAYFSFSMVEEGLEIMKMASRIGEIGNSNLISDAAIAVTLGMSTIESSIINVRINLQPLGDEKVTTELEEKMSSIRQEAQSVKEKAFEIIGKSLNVE